MSRPRLLSFQLLVAMVAVLLWHLLTTVPIGGVTLLPPFFFSTPSDVALRIAKWLADGTIWRHLWITLSEALLAFVTGSIAGIAIGFWFARQPTIAQIFDPYVKMTNALPRIVLAPIFALWLGLGIWSKVALGFTLVFPIVFFNVYQGVDGEHEGGQHHHAGEDACDVEHALRLLDHVAEAGGRAEILPHHRADHRESYRGMQGGEHP